MSIIITFRGIYFTYPTQHNFYLVLAYVEHFHSEPFAKVSSYGFYVLHNHNFFSSSRAKNINQNENKYCYFTETS